MNVTVNHILQLKEWAEGMAGQKGIRSVIWCNVVTMEKQWKWINSGKRQWFADKDNDHANC